MTQIKNNINTYADLTAYNADTNKEYPNISYIEGTDEVKYATDPRVVCVYNITDTSAATTLFSNTSKISYLIIDGVLQPSVVSSYQFDTTGEHIVKFGTTDNTLYQTFYGRKSITSVTIPDNITLIDLYTFALNPADDTTNISNITIGKGVTSMGDRAFWNRKVTNLTIYATTPPTLGTQALDNRIQNIYVPAASVETYKAASGWSNLASKIQAIPSV